MTSLAAAAQISATLFANDVVPEERLRVLQQFFSPPIGSQIELDPTELAYIKFKKDRFAARGFITISPPKGRCLIIQKNRATPDYVVCEKRTLSFNFYDLSYNGQLYWEVTTGKGDLGTEISWQTPYRLAQIVPGGQLFQESNLTVALTCTPTDGVSRSIVVTSLHGHKWRIDFPEFDTLMPQPEKEPNLFIRSAGTPSPAKSDKKDKKGHGDDGKKEKESDDAKHDEKKDGDDAKPDENKEGDEAKHDEKKKGEDAKSDENKEGDEAKHDEKDEKKEGEKSSEAAAKPDGDAPPAMGQGLVAKKKTPKIEYRWNIHPLGTYEMPARYFKMLGTPPSDKGSCRYRFTGAPFDPNSGVVECVNTETYDAVIVPLTCAKGLGPRLAPIKKGDRMKSK